MISGQEEAARKLLTDSIVLGHWLLLQVNFFPIFLRLFRFVLRYRKALNYQITKLNTFYSIVGFCNEFLTLSFGATQLETFMKTRSSVKSSLHNL